MRRSRPRTPAHNRRLRARRKKYRTLTRFEWDMVLSIFEHRCAYCRVHTSEAALTKDCVLPNSRNGVYAMWNVVPACAPCNGGKASKSVFHWMKRKGYDAEAFEARMQEVWQAWLALG